MSKNFQDIALKIIQDHSNNINLISFSLAIVRRLATNSKYKEEIASNFLYTLLTFIKIFSETQEQKSDEHLDELSKLGIAFIYKEILGSLGALAVDDKHREEIVKNNGIF